MPYFNASNCGWHHEQIDGPRQIAEPQTAKEIKAGKRPRMVDNPVCRIPAAAVEVTSERFEELMLAQSKGKQIVAHGGKPVAIDPVQDEDERQSMRRKQRDRRLASSDWTQLADVTLPEAVATLWKRYRAALRDLDMTGTDWPPAPTGGK